MNDLISIVEKAYHYKNHLFSGRFLPPLLLGLLAWALIAYVPGIGLYAGLAAAAVAAAALWQAVSMLPWEKKWFKAINQQIDACEFEQAQRLIDALPRVLGYTARIELLHVQYSLEDDKNNTPGAYAALQKAHRHTLLPKEKLAFDWPCPISPDTSDGMMMPGERNDDTHPKNVYRRIQARSSTPG